VFGGGVGETDVPRPELFQGCRPTRRAPQGHFAIQHDQGGSKSAQKPSEAAQAVGTRKRASRLSFAWSDSGLRHGCRGRETLSQIASDFCPRSNNSSECVLRPMTLRIINVTGTSRGSQGHRLEGMGRPPARVDAERPRAGGTRSHVVGQPTARARTRRAGTDSRAMANDRCLRIA